MRKIKESVSQVGRLMKEWDFEKNNELGIDPTKLGSQSNTYAYWKCRFGHSWKAKINNRYNSRGCPECSKRRFSSFPEQSLFFYLKQKFPDAINRYRDVFKNGMELDIFIPSLKTGIEYDGKAWHTDEKLEIEKTKYEICKANDIYLIRVKENRDHYKDKSLNVADLVIQVAKTNNYHYLDYAIRTVLFQLGDFYFNPNEDEKTTISYMLKGPRVSIDVDSKRDKNAILESYLVELEQASFGSKYPEFSKLWNKEKNGNLTPYMFSAGSTFKVWWKDSLGHEWQNSFSVMSRGSGCPYCSGQKVLKGFNDLETVFPEIASQWDFEKNGDMRPDMFTAHSGHYVTWRCNICNQNWTSRINNRTSNGRGCPICSHRKVSTGYNDLRTMHPELASEWNQERNGNLRPEGFLPNSNKIVWWKCSKCGYEYKALINNRSKGTGCKKCAGQVLIPRKNDLGTLFPDIAAEWDFEKNNGISPEMVFPMTNKKYHWICKNGHRWESNCNNRVNGKGCPYCAGNKVLLGFNDLKTTYPEIAAEWHPTKNGNLSPENTSMGHVGKVWFLCPTCKHSYESTIGNKRKGFGKCPYCSSRKTRAMKILNVDTGMVFDTLKEAAAFVGKTNIDNIRVCCLGRTNTAYGYHWEYVVAENE